MVTNDDATTTVQLNKDVSSLFSSKPPPALSAESKFPSLDPTKTEIRGDK